MSAITLTDEQRLDWLRLIRSDNIGPRTFRTLINRHGSAREALGVLPYIARKTDRTLVLCTREEALKEMERARKLGIRFLAAGEAGYPAPLAATDSAPPLLAVRGNLDILSQPMVALVGSRNASAAGLAFTEKLARGLGRAGFVIVSGLARGIDTKAHTAALETGTVAVLAGGHERIYPHENLPLLEKILDKGGAVISEMPLAWEPRARDFPRRNRIVSGLSYGTIVVEAALRSGSLITARFALEQGREVFAVPGSPLDPRAEGTNDLLRQNATLCTGVTDVITALEPMMERRDWRLESETSGLEENALPSLFTPQQETFSQETFWDEWDGFSAPEKPGVPELSGMNDPASYLLSLLGPVPVSLDELTQLSGLPVRLVQATILELELAGDIAYEAGRLLVRSQKIPSKISLPASTAGRYTPPS
jgi:DNA processing protein